MKRTIFLATVIVATLLFVSATVWEGVTDVATAGDKPGNFSIATNAFPRNTVVDITNLENGKKVRVRVVSVLETNGLLATLSRNAAESIDLRSNATCRIRMTQPADDIAFAHYKLGPITPAITIALDTADALAVNDKTPAAIAAVEPAPADTPAKTVSPPMVAPTSAVAQAPAAEVPAAETPIAESVAYADTETVRDDAIVAVADDTAADPFTETVTETTTVTTVTETTTTTTVTETAVANNSAKTPETVTDDSFDPTPQMMTATVSAVGAEPAAPELTMAPESDTVLPAAIEVVAQPVPQAAEPVVASQSRVATAPQSRSTTTRSTAAPAAPVNILPSEERLPAADQVAIDPRYLAPPIKAERASPQVTMVQETTRPAAPTSPAVAAPTTPAYTATPTQFSPFQVPLISRLEPNKWYVQVGVYTRPDYVEDEINRIGSGYPLAIQNVGTDSNPLFRVLLGPLNQGESSAMLKRFQSIGYTDAFVRYN